MTAALVSSKRMDWRTPHALLEALREEFGELFDPCREPFGSAGLIHDALCEDWRFPAFVNPPYGRAIGMWMQKVAEEGRKGIVIALVPARTDTSWWHESVMGEAAEVRLIRGRLHFDGHENGAPFPSALIVYRPHDHATRFVAANSTGRAL